MKLRISSAVGEALNFGLRRMDTIMRVAWLPVVLLLILDMTTVFSVLSVALGRLVTFSDVATYMQAQNALPRLAQQGWQENVELMGIVLASSFTFQAILVSSFMAPLIRYAGLGERPSAGAVKLEFGANQVRYILAAIASILVVGVFIFLPAGVTAYFTLEYIREAMTQTYASFPNPESLHTIALISGSEVIATRGEAWIYSLAIPLAAAVPFALAFWIILTIHFHPANRNAGKGAPNLFARALSTLVWGGLVVVLFWAALLSSAKIGLKSELAFIYLFAALVIVMVYYFSLRLTPYLGVVVCRRSMAPAGTLKVTRGWNVLRLWGVLIAIGVFTFLAQWAINYFAFPAISVTLGILYSATVSATQLTNSGVAAEWVNPLFIWLFNGVKILVNVFLMLFSYGVFAGFLGRLYRESERTD